MKITTMCRARRPARRNTKFTLGAAILAVVSLLSSPETEAKQAAPVHGNHFAVYVDTVLATFNLNDPPQPLDSVIFSRDVYAVDLSDPENPVPTGPVIGSNMVMCTVAGPAGFLCQGTVTLFGMGDITLAGPFVLQNPTRVAVTGGNGRFAGARGEVTALEITPDADQVYWFDLSSARN